MQRQLADTSLQLMVDIYDLWLMPRYKAAAEDCREYLLPTKNEWQQKW